MSPLICPHCRLEVRPTATGGAEIEHCPRCHARSGGALSVYLSSAERPRKRRGRLIAERLLHRQRGGHWART